MKISTTFGPFDTILRGKVLPVNDIISSGFPSSPKSILGFGLPGFGPRSGLVGLSQTYKKSCLKNELIYINIFDFEILPLLHEIFYIKYF